MDIKQIPYFAFEVKAWDSWKERIPLTSDNIEELLQRLEDGENLFEVVPELKRNVFDDYPLRYGSFEKRNEIIINGEKFVSAKGYKSIGKLLLPYYEIVARDKIKLLAETANGYEKVIYSRILLDFPKADKFYQKGIHIYTPLDTDKILVLDRNQL